jgi:hypothetical protein
MLIRVEVEKHVFRFKNIFERSIVSTHPIVGNITVGWHMVTFNFVNKNPIQITEF